MSTSEIMPLAAPASLASLASRHAAAEALMGLMAVPKAERAAFLAPLVLVKIFFRLVYERPYESDANPESPTPPPPPPKSPPPPS